MEYEDILDDLAPCGLSCRKCFANSRGDIALLSAQLQEQLGSFDVYAERFSAFLPAFKDYPPFKELLAYLVQGHCDGCRRGTCLYPTCGVCSCYREQGVDFWFQCDEFPCDRTNFDPHLERRWRQMNERMGEIGVEAYDEETRDRPRYGRQVAHMVLVPRRIAGLGERGRSLSRLGSAGCAEVS